MVAMHDLGSCGRKLRWLLSKKKNPLLESLSPALSMRVSRRPRPHTPFPSPPPASRLSATISSIISASRSSPRAKFSSVSPWAST